MIFWAKQQLELPWTDLAAAFVYPFLTKQKEAEIDNFLTDITEEDYGLLRELKKFSRQEYRHALRVSGIAENVLLS